MKKYRAQLVDRVTGKAIQTAGGKCYVATAGGAAKIALLDEDGASASNPSALTNGIVEFYVADTVQSVDLYMQSPTGHFVVTKDLAPSGPNSIYIDKGLSQTVMVIPFSIDDTVAATETDTGFDLPDNSAVLPNGVGVDVLTLDDTETVDVGILSTEANGDADGFIALGSVALADSVIAGNAATVGSNETFLATTTLGALVNDFAAGSDVATDTGVSNKKSYVCDGTAESISYTLTAGTDTAEGFIKLPLQLHVASL